MKNMISKYISKLASEAIGSNAEIWVEDVGIEMKKGRIRGHVNVWGDFDRKALFDAIKDLKD
jgi:hypothetical protein